MAFLAVWLVGWWFVASCETGDTREEKVFRMWINSLGIDNGELYINNLFSDVQDGSAILKASRCKRCCSVGSVV